MKILKNSRGTSLVEYVLILALVVIAAIGTLKLLRGSIAAQYMHVATKIATPD